MQSTMSPVLEKLPTIRIAVELPEYQPATYFVDPEAELMPRNLDFNEVLLKDIGTGSSIVFQDPFSFGDDVFAFPD